MPPPTAKDNWPAQFGAELQRLRPDMISARKFADTIAAREFVAQRGVDPHTAAARWVATSAKPPAAPQRPPGQRPPAKP